MPIPGVIASAYVASGAAPDGQEGFRWRNDDGSETTATWAAAQDSDITAALSKNLRLRVLVNTVGDDPSTAYTLRYKKSTDVSYIAVPVGATGATPSDPAYIQGQNAAFTTTRSPAVTFGAGVQTGDIVYFFCTNSVAATAITDPSGWVNVLGANTIVASDSHTSCGVYHIVTSGENGTTTFTCTNLWNANQTGNVLAAVIRNVDQTTIVDAAGSTFSSVNTVTPSVLAAITGTGNALDSNSLVVRAVSGDSTRTYTTPASHTVRQTSNSTSGTWLGTQDALTTANTNVAATNITPSAGDEYASISVAFKRAAPPPNPVYIATSSNITAGGEATTAQLTPPDGKTTTAFTTGRMWDDENGTDSIDIAADFYTELEWCLQVQSPAAVSDIYQFRVYAGATPLDTYVTPQWTMSAAAGSIRFDASGDKLSRSAAGLESTSFTWAAWVYLESDRNAFSTFIGAEAAGLSAYAFLCTNSDGTTIRYDCSPGSPITGGASLTVGAWYYVAVVFTTGAGTNDSIFWALAADPSLSTASNTAAGGVTSSAWTFVVGNNSASPVEWVDGRIAHVRVWTAALTSGELESERVSTTPVRTSNLWAAYPMTSATDIADASGNGRDLTAAGTLTTAAGPPI